MARAAKHKDTDLLDCLDPGDLVLLGARPGHGKTLYAVKTLISAMRRGRRGWFFSLENDMPNMDSLFASVGETTNAYSKTFVFDHSDDICARHIIEHVSGFVAEKSVVAIDYLQLLDQQRKSPELQEQVKALQVFARQSGCIFVFISQIHSSFDSKHQPLPAPEDVRLPNPLDLTLFNKFLFLHDGRSRLDVPRA